MAIFSQQDKQQIEASIAAAEQQTAAEIVVATVPHCESYRDVRVLSALVVGLGGSAAVHLLMPWLEVGELFALQIALGLLGYLLSGQPALLRLLVPRQRVGAAVRREAEVRFLEHAVFNTKSRNGVLILLSELEHGVTILGDKGIHERVQGAGWEKHVTTIVTSIRAGKPAEGVSQVVDALSKVLAQHDPIQHDDVNELHDGVREH